MIICTKSADLLLRKASVAGDVTISSFDTVVSQLVLDPSVANPVRDIYIVTGEDVKSRRNIQEFKDALASKHPKSKILYISRKAKGDFITPDLAGLDGYLVNPKGPQVKEAIEKITDTEAISKAAEIVERDYENAYGAPNIGMSGVDVPTVDSPAVPNMVFESMENNDIIPEFNQEEDFVNGDIAYEPEPEPEPTPEPPPLVVPTEPTVMDDIQGQVDQDIESDLLQRINSTRKVSNMTTLMQELTASRIVKDMIESNATYGAIEDRLKSLNDAIFEIMRDNRSYKTLSEKLSAVRALLHDRAVLSSKGDTLLEQRIEEVIDLICAKTSELVNKRLEELDTSIRRISENREIDMGNARLGGLGQERVNVIIELTQMQTDISNIYKAAESLCMDSVSKIAERSADLTGSQPLNDRIKASGDTIVSDETMAAIGLLLDIPDSKLPGEFKSLLRSVILMTKKMSKVLDLDKEIIAAQQASLEYLKAKNVEDSIVAETLLKKSMRIFIGAEGSGRTIIPYLLSYYKSRQNANVLLFDITGTGKYDNYDVLVRTPEKFMTEQYQQEFCVVSGEMPNTAATAQRIMTALTKAADFYRVINVVMRPDQKGLFDIIAPDVLCVNYIVEPSPENIKISKELITDTTKENVGQRVIFNKCNIPINPLVTKLGLDDVLDVQFCIIPTINEITDASIRRYNPYGISSVSILLEDVLKYA